VQDFLKTGAPTDPQSDVVFEDHAPAYVEVLVRAVDGSAWYSAYILRVDDSTVACATNWEQRFDAIVAGFSNPKYGKIYIDEYRKVLPTFFELVDNTADERFGDGTLTQINDPLDMNRKWVIAALVGGVTAKNDDQRILDAVDRVVALSTKVSGELAHGKLSRMAMVRIGLRGGAVGYRESKEWTEKWEKGLEWLKPLLGQ
jgi:hypothetical protein